MPPNITDRKDERKAHQDPLGLATPGLADEQGLMRELAQNPSFEEQSMLANVKYIYALDMRTGEVAEQMVLLKIRLPRRHARVAWPVFQRIQCHLDDRAGASAGDQETAQALIPTPKHSSPYPQPLSLFTPIVALILGVGSQAAGPTRQPLRPLANPAMSANSGKAEIDP